MFISVPLRSIAGVCAVAFAASFTGCATDSTTGSATGSNSNSSPAYVGYNAGTGMSSQNVQSSSPLPGPRYYQSDDNPFHSN